MNKDEILLEKIKSAPSIAIFAHHYPDGDCVGSEMGLKKILLANFPAKRVFALGENSAKWAEVFGPTDVVDERSVADSLAIVVDHNAYNRVGDERIRLCKDGIRFDHHIGGLEPYPFPAIVEIDAVSASQVILEFCLRNNLIIPAEALDDLFIAFLDDKRQYGERNAPKDAAEKESLFLSLGANYERDLAYVKHKSAGSVEYERKILANKISEGGILYCAMKKEDYETLGLPYPEAGAMSSFLLESGIEEVALLFTYSDSEIRLSARSRGEFSVEQLCKIYGGGGHQQAAGASFKDIHFDIHEVVNEAKKLLKTF